MPAFSGAVLTGPYDNANAWPIGGWSVPSWGGWITVSQLLSNGQIPNSSAQIIDVQQWQYKVRYNEKKLVCSGLLGCPAARRSAVFYDYRLQILWNPMTAPENYMRAKMGFSLNLLLGQDYTSISTGLQGVNLWYTPLACVEQIIPIVDAQNHKLIGETIIGSAHTHTFFLATDQAQLTPYMTYLNSMNTRLMR